MWWRKKEMSREQVYDWLRARGAAKAVVTFSGGHDNGWIEKIEFLAQDGASIGGLDVTSAAAHDKPEFKALVRPVYARYGSFAVDLTASGTLTYDVGARTVTMELVELFDGDEEGDPQRSMEEKYLVEPET